MARIAGVNIPNHQHTEIGLTAIFGVGRTRSRSHWLAECIIMRLIPVSPMIWRR